jgi:membrane protein implicated in regulation of membrane protease activity
LRPVIMKYRKKGAEAQTSLIGQEVVVCETIEASLGCGRVQTSDKMTWKAQTKDGAVLEEGAHARVVAQESIKLIVERI